MQGCAVAEPWVDVQLWRFALGASEGWDRAQWDVGQWDAGYPAATEGWSSIICDVRGVDIQRGSQGVTVAGGYEAGILTFELDNRDGYWSEFIEVDTGTFEPALSAGVQIRVIAGIGTGAFTTLFRGWVENWYQVWTEADDYLVVTAVDGWADLVQQASAVPWTPGTMGERVEGRLYRLLRQRAGWDDDQYPIRMQQGHIFCIGSAVMGSTERGLVLTQTSVADEILKTAQSDGGAAFLDGDGSFVYLNRTRFTQVDAAPAYAAGQSPRPAQGTVPLFGDWCGTPQTDELPYTDLQWSYDGMGPANVVVVANAEAPDVRDEAGNYLGPAWQTTGYTAVDDALSGRHRQLVTLGDLRFTTYAEAQALANFYLATYSDNFLRVTNLAISPELDDRLWQVVLDLRLQDHLRILRRTKTNQLDMECLVAGVQYQLQPTQETDGQGKHYAKWVVRYNTTDAVSMVSNLGVSRKPLQEVMP